MDQWDPEKRNPRKKKKMDVLVQVPCNFQCISAVFTKNVARLGSPKPDSVVLASYFRYHKVEPPRADRCKWIGMGRAPFKWPKINGL